MFVRSALTWLILLACLDGCSHKRDNDPVLERIRRQSATEILGDVKVSLLDADGAPTLQAVPIGREFAVGGTFRKIGDAATRDDYKPSILIAKLVKKNRQGTFSIYGNCACPVAYHGGEYTFAGTMQAIADPGDYLLRASYIGTDLAECTVTLR